MADNEARNGRRGLRSFRTVGVIAAVASIALVVIWLKVVRGADDPTSHLATFVARRGPLAISVLVSGTITAREEIILRNEVEGRTSIVRLVPEGTMVKKGDLLVELDASTLKDAIIDQDILAQKADAAYISAQETLAVIENQAKSDIDKAELTLRFARQDLQQYVDGNYPKDVNSLKAKISLAEETRKRAEDVNDWSERLYKEKYLSETEYLADRLAVQRSRLEQDLAMSDLDLLENFTYHRKIEQLTSDANQAGMALERTNRKASADVVQAKADLKAKELEYKRQQEKFKKIEDQLKKTMILAPMDGMVVYATSAGRPFDRREPIEVGVEVTERQDLISLPTAASMKAQVNIHETSLEKIQVGLPVIITVDALAGRKFLGRVAMISPLPDARSTWMNPDLKIYPTDIYLEDTDSSLRTGVSCKAEIIVAQYEDAVYVPVQAVLRVAGEHTLYVVRDGGIEERKVEVGLDDNNMIRIISGLDEGEVVLMTPPLKSGAVEPGSKMAGAGSPDDLGATDAMRQRVNEKLEEANGAGQGVPGQKLSSPDGSKGPSSDQMEQMRSRLENMSPEERQKEMEKMKQSFENMSPQEREEARQRFGGAGSRQGTGSRQGAGSRQGGGGSRQGEGQRQTGGARPPESERNQ